VEGRRDCYLDRVFLGAVLKQRCAQIRHPIGAIPIALVCPSAEE